MFSLSNASICDLSAWPIKTKLISEYPINFSLYLRLVRFILYNGMVFEDVILYISKYNFAVIDKGYNPQFCQDQGDMGRYENRFVLTHITPTIFRAVHLTIGSVGCRFIHNKRIGVMESANASDISFMPSTVP